MILRILTFAFVFCLFGSDLFSENARILRFPNSSETQVSFSHAGDLYVAPISGGLARRITSSEGMEIMPRFSPDGKSIGFVGEYDGNVELYTIPAVGGSPFRVTYQMDRQNVSERMGPNKILFGWSKDGSLFYRSRHEKWHIMEAFLYKASADGKKVDKLPVPSSGYAYLSPDESKIAYNKIYREFRTWKRYRGGQADEIWIYDFKSKQLEQITDNDAQDIMPMWSGNKIYYISDRDKVMNLFAYDLTTKQTKKITNFTDYDVKFPSLGAKHIAFENAGYIYLMDLATENVAKIDIQINEDFPSARTSIISVNDKIREYEISKDGDKVIFNARGDLFHVDVKTGEAKNLNETNGEHERNVIWAPNNELIAYVSDKSGEDEIYVSKPDGSDVKQITTGAVSYRYAMKWSPDSKKLLASDKSMRLYLIDVDSKKVTEIAKSKQWEITDFNWSPDSKFVVYSDILESQITAIFIYSLDNAKTQRVSNPFFNASQAVFTPGGNYLMYVSKRNFQASISEFEWNFQYSDMAKIYGVPLNKDGKSPFLPDFSFDSVKKAEGPVKVTIDFDGIEDRVFELPINAANYYNLYPTADHKLYYVKAQSGKGAKTFVYDFKEKKESEVGDFAAWIVSANAKKILIAKGGKYYVENLADKIELKNDIKTDNLKVKLDKRVEWEQVYNEVWRQMRDFFYDPNMHNVDWAKMKERYKPLLAHVNHRTDLTYVLSELISELNVGHAYVGGGDAPKIDKVGLGLLGAEFNFDSGKYKISKIFKGQNWEDKFRSPLTEPGIDVKVGAYIVAIDGKELTAEYSPYQALEDKAGKIVTISVNSKANLQGAKEFKIKTLATEEGIRYLDWVESRREIVEKATNGRVGYLHIPDMGVGNGLNEFAKYFFSQTDKEALIIDDRYNGGGNVSPMIIERLKRTYALARHHRNQAGVGGKPESLMAGPVVCLINEYSMSDGDLFPYQFKQENLGKLIGKRSWGGVIGIRGSLPFLDGGYLMRPEFAHFGLDGRWVLENEGMSPDIEVDNHPAKVMDGIDEQLNKAIEVILEDIKSNKKPQLPKLPSFPIRD